MVIYSWPLDLEPAACRPGCVERAIIDWLPGFLDNLLTEPVPCGSLGLLEVHHLAAVRFREVIGYAKRPVSVLAFPSNVTCRPSPEFSALVVAKMAILTEHAPIKLEARGQTVPRLAAFEVSILYDI